MSEQIRILITDDHPIVRQGIKLVLETADDLTVVGEAENGEECLGLIGELTPDIVLLDLRMPKMDGLTTLKNLSQLESPPAVIILTTYNEDQLLAQSLKEGAKGFLLKDVDRDTLIRSIRSAARGESLLQPDVLARLLATDTSGSSTGSGDSDSHGLTDRELEVLRSVAAGERNKEIAAKLFISERTVKAHLTHIFQKLGVDSRAAAVAVGSKLRILEAE